MTAVTPAYAHAYQVICLTRHLPTAPCLNFRLPKTKARYPHLPNVRATTRERGKDFQGWAIYNDGGTRVTDGETLAGWVALLDLPMEELILCLVRLSPPRLIVLSLVPELTPITLLS